MATENPTDVVLDEQPKTDEVVETGEPEQAPEEQPAEEQPETTTDAEPATTDDTPDEAKEPEEPKLTPEEEEAAVKRSEAAKKGAATRAANQAQTALVEDIYKHLRHVIGAEVSIDQARAIVEMVQAPAAAE